MNLINVFYLIELTCILQIQFMIVAGMLIHLPRVYCIQNLQKREIDQPFDLNVSDKMKRCFIHLMI